MINNKLDAGCWKLDVGSLKSEARKSSLQYLTSMKSSIQILTSNFYEI